VIELTLLVHEQGTAEAHLFDIGACKVTSLESNDDDPNAKRAEALFRVLHLHEVPSTGQSPEMAVENHQQPGAAVILEATDFARSIGQTKRHRGLTNETVHEAYGDPLPDQSRPPDLIIDDWVDLSIDCLIKSSFQLSDNQPLRMIRCANR
jgi:hypothetical protein